MLHAILLQVPPFKKAFADAIPYVDYLFGNETEAVAFAESEGWSTRNVTQIAAKVIQCKPYPISDCANRQLSCILPTFVHLPCLGLQHLCT